MNGIRIYLLRPLLIFLIMTFAVSFMYADENNSGDVASITELIAKINRAWTADNGVDIMKQVISEKAAIIMLNNQEATVMNKKEFLQAFDTLLKKNRPKKHIHEIIKLTMNGPVAYEIGVIHQVNADNSAGDSIVLHIYVKEQTGWMLISSTPAYNLK